MGSHYNPGASVGYKTRGIGQATTEREGSDGGYVENKKRK